MKIKSFKKLLTFSSIVTMGVLLSFSTVFAATPIVTAPVNIGTAGNYAILAETGISTVPDSVITGDIGVSPIVATAITWIYADRGCHECIFNLNSSNWKGIRCSTMFLQLPVILLQL